MLQIRGSSAPASLKLRHRALPSDPRPEIRGSIAPASLKQDLPHPEVLAEDQIRGSIAPASLKLEFAWFCVPVAFRRSGAPSPRPH